MQQNYSIELILIGNELLLGKKQDANLQWLGSFLFTHGLTLNCVQVVDDSMDGIKTSLLLAASRSNLILTSGGLGPTKDDLTKEALAQAFHKKLQFCPQAKNIVDAQYERHGRSCNYPVNRYDQLPEGAMALNNPAGFAPAIQLPIGTDKNIYLLPGVPKEFQAIVEQTLWPRIKKNFGTGVSAQLIWRTFGMPEEKIFSSLVPALWDDLARYGSVSSLPHSTGVDVGLNLFASDSQKLLDLTQEAQTLVANSALYPHVWTTKNESLPEMLVHLAKKKNATFAFAESCTGGMAASLITGVSGSSEVFKGSLVTYQTELKEKILGITFDQLNLGVVSESIAREMADKCRQKTGADYVLSFTGYAGPTGSDDQNPTGRVWIALSTANKTDSKMYDLMGSRDERRYRFCTAGFHLLRQALL